MEYFYASTSIYATRRSGCSIQMKIIRNKKRRKTLSIEFLRQI